MDTHLWDNPEWERLVSMFPKYDVMQEWMDSILMNHYLDLMIAHFLLLTYIIVEKLQLSNPPNGITLLLLWNMVLLVALFVPHDRAMDVVFALTLGNIARLLCGYPPIFQSFVQNNAKEEQPTQHRRSTIPEHEFTGLPDHITGAGVVESDEDEKHEQEPETISPSTSKPDFLKREDSLPVMENPPLPPVIEIINLEEEY